MHHSRNGRPIIRFFRLTLTYGGDIYAVMPLVPPPYGARKAIRLMKLTGDRKVYQVRVFQNHPGCTCKGFRYRGHCKHIEMLRAALMLD